MQSRLKLWLAGAAIVAVPLWLTAQQGGRGGSGQVGNVTNNVLGRGAPQLVPDNLPFNKRDLSGVWLGNKYGYNATYEPPMTPEGKKKFDAQKPSYGVVTPGSSRSRCPTPTASTQNTASWFQAL